MSALSHHLVGGITTVCQAWAIERLDGVALGFTDHDCSLEFDGITFRPQGGMTATALEQTTGLAVNNAEAVGVLSDVGLTEADIGAGLFDGARLTAWQVNWADPTQREITFRGRLGDIQYADGQFITEIRGLTDALNQPRGRSYQKGCSVLLGDACCGVDLDQALFRLEGTLTGIEDARVLTVSTDGLHDSGWFTRGSVLIGAGGYPLKGAIKSDKVNGDARRIELWEPLSSVPVIGEVVVLFAGCDKRFDTCRYKFLNAQNFMGFPDIPGDDWMLRYPGTAEPMDGKSRR
ncbi:DUF2163 domain-containing protein [Donghicola mangrovi]|uniref:DUF2163 domain-containing protein n=1 Tax=Donghicola mangrovi TaxID=2729614 RepID=A0A850Q739_9RHOB|nr:DUF2163 domain-containing protein [Donghicola mangrovi]NVO22828.1 DUF2163 domain-containing protein [Donghicola mangrovi]